MKIIITEDKPSKIEVSESLEPTFASYTIEQGINVINLDEYQLSELVRALQFISR